MFKGKEESGSERRGWHLLLTPDREPNHADGLLCFGWLGLAWLDLTWLLDTTKSKVRYLRLWKKKGKKMNTSPGCRGRLDEKLCAEFGQKQAWLRMGILWLSCRGVGWLWRENRFSLSESDSEEAGLPKVGFVSFGCASFVQWEERRRRRRMSDYLWGWGCCSWIR